MECSFTCNWFHSYRSSCVESPCLSEGNSCETVGAPTGSLCSEWCCVYEPVRGLIFLPLAVTGLFLLCVLVRCCHRCVILRRRAARAAKIKIDDGDNGLDEEASSQYDEDEAREPYGSAPPHPAPQPRSMPAPTSRPISHPFATSRSDDASTMFSPVPHRPKDLAEDDEDFEEYDDGASHNQRGKYVPWHQQ